MFSDLSGTQWMSKDELELVLMEEIADIEYNNFLNAMNRLVSMPYSYKIKEFIEKYRKPLMTQSNISNLLKPQYDEQGRMFITTYGKRKIHQKYGNILKLYRINFNVGCRMLEETCSGRCYHKITRNR